VVSFAGGSFLLGGLLLNEDKYIDFGIQLANSYYEVYRGTASGIGPEGFRWVDSGQPESDDNNQPPPADQADFYDDAGFWATAPYYILRPETVESLWYAYRITGDSTYQDLAWEAFEHITELCRTGSGFSGLRDVTQADGGSYDDFQESFFLAETLKYFYLLFGPESAVQLNVDGPNEWVFNTEAHPFKVRGTSS
jgi:mannosyl-oligosaccharide alpha-1,2-mannosidase